MVLNGTILSNKTILYFSLVLSQVYKRQAKFFFFKALSPACTAWQQVVSILNNFLLFPSFSINYTLRLWFKELLKFLNSKKICCTHWLKKNHPLRGRQKFGTVAGVQNLKWSPPNPCCGGGGRDFVSTINFSLKIFIQHEGFPLACRSSFFSRKKGKWENIFCTGTLLT